MAIKTPEQSTSDADEACIDLPGDRVQCWVSTGKVKVILRKWRDIFFDINLRSGALYTVASRESFYDPRMKKQGKITRFADGERLHLWVPRGFNSELVLMSGDKILGRYLVHKLDSTAYGADPKVKPEPLLITMDNREAKGALMCSLENPFGLDESQQLLSNLLTPKVDLLNSHGSQYPYILPSNPPKTVQYVAVTEARSHEVQPQVVQQLENGTPVVGTPNQIFATPQNPSEPSLLYAAMASAVNSVASSSVLASSITKETAGYFQENLRILDRIGMKVRIEKKSIGKYRVAFIGETISERLSQATGKPNPIAQTRKSMPLGSHDSKAIDGGYGRTGKNGYGGFKRIFLTTTKNLVDGLKIQIIGTVIDLIGDVNAVYFDEKGSRDLSEFLGRAGVSLAKAGLTAALGSALAALTATALVAAGLPAVVIIGVAIIGYIVSAMVIDYIDERFQIKQQAATLAK